MSDERGRKLSDEELEQLLLRFADKGEHADFDRLYEETSTMVFAKCKAFFNNGEIAHDCVQNVYIKVFTGASKFRGGSVRGWLKTIAGNICIDEWRATKNGSPVDDLTIETESSLVVGLCASSSDFFIAFRRALDQLSPNQKLCLEPKLEGYSYEEIAASLGIAVSAVKTHIQNGLRMLRKLLAPWLKGPR
jgi:RNA polymerase sigma-70 factor (ECF subfamily)